MTQLPAIYLEKTYPEKSPPDLANPSAMSTAFTIRAHTRSFHAKAKNHQRYPIWFKEHAARIAACAEDLLGTLGKARHDDAFDKLDELYDLGDALDAEQEKRRLKNRWIGPLDFIKEYLEILGRKIAYAKAVEKRARSLRKQITTNGEEIHIEPLKPLPPEWGEIIVATVNKTVADSIRRGEGDPYRHRFLLTLIPPVFDPRKKGLWLASHPKSDGSKRFRTTTDPEEAYLFNGIKGEKALRKLKDEYPGHYLQARMDSANGYQWLKEEAGETPAPPEKTKERKHP
uniref:Uncharacterized protein n=1 Tax=Candidatus Kentrum sp. LPFa TaxID=2126335 RepID=A0A450X0E0_9GAMM|nr:MAG: hypothetical protein BECKLPF1236B_GA0070989_13233 [Candidatus Kentron sp. LPFa]